MDTCYLLADLFVLPWADSRGARTAMPNRAPHTSIRRTEFMEYCRRANGLLCLDVGRPDHLAPLVGFIGDELPERGADVIDIGSTPNNKPANVDDLGRRQRRVERKWLAQKTARRSRAPPSQPQPSSREAPD